jgi:iron complex outermembrane recepter protein
VKAVLLFKNKPKKGTVVTERQTTFFKALLASSISSLVIAGAAAPALAQDTAANTDVAQLETILVTGSRIARPEVELANPVVTVDAAKIENSGQVNVTEILLRNPALLGSLGNDRASGSSQDIGFGQTGVNFLDLRNLGTDRTLVLVNGKRHIAGESGTAAVDINSIPQDLIERIDVLTGGASAVYGADGVSGVVNFILKRDFTGLSARGQTGVSGRGDAQSHLGSVIYGQNFLDDRGNFAISYEYAKQSRLNSRERRYLGDPAQTFELLRNQDDFPDNPNVPDRILYNNVTWADSAPGGAVDVDFDGLSDYTGLGQVYDRGIPLRSAGGRAIGGDNTPTAGYFGDLLPLSDRHAINLLTSFEFSEKVRFFAEAKYVNSKAYSVGQPSFDFFTYLTPDNAFLNQRLGGLAPDGALLTRDNLDLGARGETIDRETIRTVVGFEGDILPNLRYEVSYVYGKLTTRNKSDSYRIGDRYYAALDAVVDPATGNIVCRSTLDPLSNIDPNNFDGPATTFTPGANSPCRPLNLLGEGVASQEAIDFVSIDLLSTSKVTQQVLSGSVNGDFGSFLELPGGSIGYALGAEYRRETSVDTPDQILQNGETLEFGALAPNSGKFNVKEVFGEVNVPLLRDMPLAYLLSFGGAFRYSDYSTVGSTKTWKVDAIYAPVADIRFRGTYSQAVRAPNIGELFAPQSGTFLFVDDPCDPTNIGEGTSFRAANCQAALTAAGLTPAQIAGFSPTTDPVATTSRPGFTGGNPDLQEESAKTWTVGVVIQPSFVPGLTMTFDWYNIKLKDAINTATAQEVVDLCVDQPSLDNQFCANVSRETGTGFVDSFLVGPQNVANFKTEGADFSISYAFEPKADIGRFDISLVGGYLKKLEFIPSIGADVDDDLREPYSPRWSANFDLNWTRDIFSVNYTVAWWEKTKRFTTEQVRANPDIAAPEFLFYKARWEHDIRFAVDLEERFQLYSGVNNVFDAKPSVGDLTYPVSGRGRYFYFGAKVKL